MQSIDLRCPEPALKRRRDWARVLRDLAAAGCSRSVMAKECCRQPSTVRAWAEGGDPKETDARIVLAMYAKHCPDQYARHQAEFEIRLGAAFEGPR